MFRILLLAALSILSLTLSEAQESHALTINVRIAESVTESFHHDGRLLVFIGNSRRPEPRTRTWPNGANHILATNITGWRPSMIITAHEGGRWLTTTDHSLDAFPRGTYYVQALWDQDTLESRIDAPGNLYSEVVEVHLNRDRGVDLVIDQQIGKRALISHPLVAYVEMRSDILSAWWGKEMRIKAAVLLPHGFQENTSERYPLRVNIAGYGGRYNRINRVMRNQEFAGWWDSEQAPQMVNLFLDGEGPFGDCYQLDSDNSGPYGRALTEELIPYVEETYRCIGTPAARFLDGCSTGGWVSLALQLFYPDYFNGTWSYSPDPVDFTHNQLINIYKDENAFYNEYGYLRPVARDVTGDPRISLQDFIQYENVLGRSNTYVTSGGQFSAFTALYSPKGDDGLPVPLFDPVTGKIDRAVAEHWKKYDLAHHTETNWATLGPRINGKIWIWMGDMDNFYLNPAVHSFKAMLEKQKKPSSDAQVHITPMEGHCWQFDHREVLEMMWDKWLQIRTDDQ